MDEPKLRGASARTSRRQLLKHGAGLAVASVVAGPLLEACTPASPQTGTTATAAPTAVKGGHLTEGGNIGQITGFNPLLFMDNGLFSMYQIMFESLLALKPSGELFGQLAESVPQVASDGVTYTFKLRNGIKWSDGRPFTAEDVVFTYRLMYHPDYAEVKALQRSQLAAVLADVQAPDPQTVVMKTKQPSASFLAVWGTLFILPKAPFGDVTGAAFNTHPFNQAPSVSLGPFKFVEHQKGVAAKFSRNDSYYRGAPLLDTYVITSPSSEDSAINQLKTGEIDLRRSFAFSRMAELSAVPHLSVRAIPYPGGVRVWYNLDPNKSRASRIFASKAVRQAFLYGANRAGSVGTVLLGNGTVPDATGTYYPSFWANDPSSKKYPYDKAKAEELLEAGGWKRGASGVREKDGTPLKFEFVTTSQSAEWSATAQIFAQNWKEIGADVSLRLVTTSALIGLVTAREFDVAFWNWVADSVPDPDVSVAFHSRNIVGGQNYGGYKNAEVDSLFDEGLRTFKQEERKAVYLRVQKILDEEVPSWVPWFWSVIHPMNKRVRDFNELGPYAPNYRLDMHKTWVADGK